MAMTARIIISGGKLYGEIDTYDLNETHLIITWLANQNK